MKSCAALALAFALWGCSASTTNNPSARCDRSGRCERGMACVRTFCVPSADPDSGPEPTPDTGPPDGGPVGPPDLGLAAARDATPPCMMDRTWCGFYCAKLKDDDRNCGRCGVACAFGERCRDSVCD